MAHGYEPLAAFEMEPPLTPANFEITEFTQQATTLPCALPGLLGSRRLASSFLRTPLHLQADRPRVELLWTSSAKAAGVSGGGFGARPEGDSGSESFDRGDLRNGSAAASFTAARRFRPLGVGNGAGLLRSCRGNLHHGCTVACWRLSVAWPEECFQQVRMLRNAVAVSVPAHTACLRALLGQARNGASGM